MKLAHIGGKKKSSKKIRWDPFVAVSREPEYNPRSALESIFDMVRDNARQVFLKGSGEGWCTELSPSFFARLRSDPAFRREYHYGALGDASNVLWQLRELHKLMFHGRNCKYRLAVETWNLAVEYFEAMRAPELAFARSVRDARVRQQSEYRGLKTPFEAHIREEAQRLKAKGMKLERTIANNIHRNWPKNLEDSRFYKRGKPSFSQIRKVLSSLHTTPHETNWLRAN